MSRLPDTVDTYLLRGCGRCELFDSPACKVNRWRTELEVLRAIMQSTELTEEVKWGVPCYTLNGKNVVLFGALKESVSISFLNGALLNDPAGILQKAGENSQVDRLLRFTHIDQIVDATEAILDFAQQAIAYTAAGKKVERQAVKVELPEEFVAAFQDMPGLERAFYALTPGRQRGYLLHFSQAKQSTTRAARIAKSADAILRGKGLME
ncbi:MAG: hypothetical protein C0424_05945 [Sphingobacteriaceae bacterium]|nr:hypothetical protein [Sphingobacteriaceae bacterium]